RPGAGRTDRAAARRGLRRRLHDQVPELLPGRLDDPRRQLGAVGARRGQGPLRPRPDAQGMKRAVVIGCLALLVAGCGTGGTSGTYRVNAIFDNASFLIPGRDVRIAGANVGTVTGVKLTPDHRALIEMRIDRRFAPFRSVAYCFIAPQSLIGERFIQCAPGTPRGRPLAGHPPTV